MDINTLEHTGSAEAVIEPLVYEANLINTK